MSAPVLKLIVWTDQVASIKSFEPCPHILMQGAEQRVSHLLVVRPSASTRTNRCVSAPCCRMLSTSSRNRAETPAFPSCRVILISRVRSATLFRKAAAKASCKASSQRTTTAMRLGTQPALGGVLGFDPSSGNAFRQGYPASLQSSPLELGA